jgi:hypothetical protein
VNDSARPRIAALFVSSRGIYANRPDVDPWDEARDARTYDGSLSVVAHPPCSRWCRLSGLVEARGGHRKGDDGGCFAAALAAVRRCGGVLEHPAYSLAWSTFDLPSPSRTGGWQKGLCGGWSCQIEQARYGHPAKKATWLYLFGVDDPPPMRWGFRHDHAGSALVSWCGNHNSKEDDRRRRLTRKQASATPPEFAEALIDLARRAA